MLFMVKLGKTATQILEDFTPRFLFFSMRKFIQEAVELNQRLKRTDKQKDF